MADMSLTGIRDARNFREMVLDQRDLITDKSSPSSKPPTEESDQLQIIPLPQNIHHTLQKIEEKMK